MSDNIIYRWRALDYSGFCYGSNPPDDLPQSAGLTAFYRQPDAFKSALHEISATGNLTATPQQFARHLQRVARDAIAGVDVLSEDDEQAAQQEPQPAHALAEAMEKLLRHFTRTPSTLKDTTARGDAHAALKAYRAAAQQETATYYSIDRDPEGIRARVVNAVIGAMAFGAQGTNPPPDEHWLSPLWEIGQRIAMVDAIKDAA